MTDNLLAPRMSMGKRLKYLRKQMGMGQAQLSEKSGVSQRQISSYERDLISPRGTTAHRLAKALGTTVEWLEFGDAEADAEILADREASEPRKSQHVPILSWEEGADRVTGRLKRGRFHRNLFPVPDHIGEDAFALVVHGESMADEYPPGSIIVVDPDISPRDGDDVAALLADAGQLTFKRLSLDPEGTRLVPVNRQYPVIDLGVSGILAGVVVMHVIYRGPYTQKRQREVPGPFG